MRIRDWDDWRFHWPGRYRDVFRQPQDFFVGEELPLDDPAEPAVRRTPAVWLEPPADMGRPVWRDVLEQTQLGPAERAAFLSTGARIVGVHIASGGGSPPRRPRGGSGDRPAGHRPIPPIWRSSPTTEAGPA